MVKGSPKRIMVISMLFSFICFFQSIEVKGQGKDSRLAWGESILLKTVKDNNGIPDSTCLQIRIDVDPQQIPVKDSKPEGFMISVEHPVVRIAGYDPAGALYGCLELSRHISDYGRLPEKLTFSDSPEMNLRGTCILLMKLGTYNYPVTPEEFPFFYDKKLWIEYLDFLAENRFNYIAFWNGHPFDYFVKLDRYPEAQEGMEPGLLERNHDMLLWLCREGQKRNIRFMFQFYNIHTSVYFQETHHLPDEIRKPTPLLADYTSYCIERFVSEFPDVGLYICAGEALDKAYQEKWLNDVIYPAVLKTGKKPPIILRSWYVDLENAPNLVSGYPGVYIERKFNVEMIAGTEIDPENKEWANLTNNFIVNIHCIANLEPFRWNPPFYIQKILQNSIQAGANGLHLYPRKAWRWPYGCEIGESKFQWDRDALWFKMWGRYAWNADRNFEDEKSYWINRMTGQFGTKEAAEHFLASFEKGADVLPAIQRLFWLHHDNHYVVAAGGKVSHFEHAPGRPFLPLTDVIPVKAYLDSIKKGQKVLSRNPEIFLASKVTEAENALNEALLGIRYTTRNKSMAKRFEMDARAVNQVVRFYQTKLRAVAAKARMERNGGSLPEYQVFIKELRKSVDIFRDLTHLTEPIYESISDVPANVPERLKVCPYHWTDVLLLYKRELKIYEEDFHLAKDPVFTAPSLQGLAGIRYGDPGLMNPRQDYPLERLAFDFSELKSEKNWSAEWFGYLKAPCSGKVTFHIVSDRGAQLTIGGNTVIDWQGKRGERLGVLDMEKGKWYAFSLVYDHPGGDNALLKVWWTLKDQERSAIPSSVLYHTPAQKRRMDHILILGNY